MPHPLAHKVQSDCFVSTGPRVGCGIQGQFCVQMETSPNNFHGIGVSRNPAVAPALPINKSRLENFMVAPSFVTTEAAHLDLVATMARFTVAHLHAIVRRAPKAGDGVAPYIAAV